MKKQLSLLLALILLVGLLAGCAKTESAPTEAAPQTAQEPAAQPTAEAPAPQEAEAPAQPAEPAEQPSEEAAPAPAEEPAPDQPGEDAPAPEPSDLPPVAEASEMKPQPAIGITYPLEGDNSIDKWSRIPMNVSSNNDFYCVPYAEQVTGVHINFVEVSEMAATEQYQLMIASGDWADLTPANTYYTGGLLQAYTDEVIIDILPDVSAYAPNFTYIYDQLDEANYELSLTNGMLLSFISIADGAYPSGGNITRGDWLDEQGLSYEGKFMTLEDFEDLMRVLHNNYGAMGFAAYDANMPVGAAFDTMIPGLINPNSIAQFRYGDEVVSGWVTDGYRDYLNWFLGLLDEGIIPPILDIEQDKMQQNIMCGNGEIAVWGGAPDKVDECGDFTTDPEDAGFRARALPTVVFDEAAFDEPYLWKETPQLVQRGDSITVTSDKVDLCLQWMNYFWTDEGSRLINYGIQESVAKDLDMSFSFDAGGPVFYGTYEIDENGDWYWGDALAGPNSLTNKERANNETTIKEIVVAFLDHDRLFELYSDNSVQAVELWDVEGTDERNYPFAITLSAEDNERVTNLQSDLLTYAAETILRVVDGQQALTDEYWSNYVSTMERMGLGEILDIYQRYYDDYIAE